MPASQLRCIVDTSVLIDLYAGEVLYAVFHLPLTLSAPDVIIAELLEPDGKMLVERGLLPIELSGADVQRAYDLTGTFRRVSVNDLFALVAAETHMATLLTGDKHLRTAAERLGISVHGVLWLLDEMLHSRVLTHTQARWALERMLQRGRRLPRDECERRLMGWH
jgi:predicted nucleic acid-binding protein